MSYHIGANDKIPMNLNRVTEISTATVSEKRELLKQQSVVLCYPCGISLDDFDSLLNHNKNSKKHRGDRFLCQICSSLFREEDDRKSHIKLIHGADAAAEYANVDDEDDENGKAS